MKWITPQEWTRLLRPGMTVFIPGSSAEPVPLIEAFEDAAGSLTGVHVVLNFVPGINQFDFLDLNPRVTVSTCFMQSSLAAHRDNRRLRFVPDTYFGMELYLRNLESLDLAIVQLAPPDSAGFCSMGPAVDFARTALSKARIRVALLNTQVPRLPLSPALPLADFHYAIRSDYPLRGFTAGASEPVSSRIAAYVSTLVRDGDTIQTGVGRIPAHSLQALTSKRRLRIHSGVITESVRSLVDCSALDPSCPMVAPSALGTSDFYNWLRDRADIRITDVSLTHSPKTLAQIDNLVALNSALEVDLTGQVNAEQAGTSSLSGPGGLPDFAYMAHRSKGGRSIIALPSTDNSGSLSRIVPHLGCGIASTLGRCDVDFVVTEHGIAELRGRSLHERRLALIAIADPTFRSSLARAQPT